VSRGLYIIGVGGFGREVLSIIRDLGMSSRLAGFVDDSPSTQNRDFARSMGATVVGPLVMLLESEDKFDAVIAIGDPSTRRALAERLSSSPVHYPTLVHPDATLGRGVSLGPGVIVAPGARLSVNIELGKHVHVDQNATIGHEVTLDDFVRVNPQACISGGVTVGAGTLIGANATVLQSINIGQGATVGAGAVVTRDVSSHVTVKGVPAK